MRTHQWKFGLAAIALILFAACGQRSPKKTSIPGGDSTTFDDSGSDPFDLDGPKAPKIPDNAKGISKAEQVALNNLAEQAPATLPQTPVKGLSKELQDELKRLQQKEKKGEDTSALRLALAGKALAECAKEAEGYAPHPNYPLMGTWTSMTCPGKAQYGEDEEPSIIPPFAISFEVTGKESNEGGQTWINKTETIPGEIRRNVSGGPATFKGLVDWSLGGQIPQNAGKFSTFQGTLDDQPQAGTGVVKGFPWYDQSNPVPCLMRFELAESKNPYPAIYQEAMKRVGACYKQALVLTSPAFSKLFGDMDPQVAKTLQSSMLGAE